MWTRARARARLTVARRLTTPLADASCAAEADALEELDGPGFHRGPVVVGHQGREQHVFQHAALRQEILILEDEADVTIAEIGQPAFREGEGSWPSMRTVPRVGVSRVPRICNSVLLPDRTAPSRRPLRRAPGGG